MRGETKQLHKMVSQTRQRGKDNLNLVIFHCVCSRIIFLFFQRFVGFFFIFIPIRITLFTFFLFVLLFMFAHFLASLHNVLHRCDELGRPSSSIYDYIPTWYHEFIYNMQYFLASFFSIDFLSQSFFSSASHFFFFVVTLTTNFRFQYISRPLFFWLFFSFKFIRQHTFLCPWTLLGATTDDISSTLFCFIQGRFK